MTLRAWRWGPYVVTELCPRCKVVHVAGARGCEVKHVDHSRAVLRILRGRVPTDVSLRLCRRAHKTVINDAAFFGLKLKHKGKPAP